MSLYMRYSHVSPSMAWKCAHCVCALPEEWISVSFFLLHPSHSLCFPPSHSFSLCLSFSLALSPSVSPSPTHLMLPPTHLPSFYPISSANTLPCRVGHVMKKWPVRALHRASYFIISRAFLPFTVHSWSAPLSLCLSVSLPFSLSLALPLSSFSSSASLAPLFLLQPHARGRLKLCEGGRERKKKEKKKSAAISTVRASPQPALP